jgi:plasmid segregation protein ParM
MSAKNEPSSPTILAGVDDGYAETKVITTAGKKVRITSSARAGIHGLSFVGSEDKLGGSYETGGHKFTIGEFIDGEETRFSDYPTSDLNRVVVNHALRLAGLAGKKVKIVTGMQVSSYFKGDVRDEAMIAGKRESMAKNVTAVDGGKMAEIVDNIVLPEAVASWFDYAYNDKGTALDMEAPAGVIDIGGKTTDCVTILPGHQIDHSRSGTGEIGVMDIYEVIGNKLRGEYGEGAISRKVYDQAVRTGTIRRFGKTINIQPTVDAAIEEVSDRVLREAKRHFGSGAHLDVILFVGGGAAFMKQLVSAFPNARVQPEPEFANARGMLKYLQLNA